MDDASRLILYKMLHLAGLMTLFTGVAVVAIQGKDGPLRKQALVFHGIGLFLLLLSGFGMMAILKKISGDAFSYTAGWVILKLVIWLFFGGMIVLAKNGVLKGQAAWIVCVLAGVLAAWAGIAKPF